MSFWDQLANHASALSLGSDALLIVASLKAQDGAMFASSFAAFLKDLAREGKIKEITPELADALEPHIEGIASILIAHVNQ